ncbi:MAG: xanthine dehydrogenase family protein subunit M [Acidimicrobiia bacterium]
MKPAPFSYHAPSTVDQATSLLLELGGGAIPLAGGQSLIPLMNLGLVRPQNLVDLGNIAQLHGIESTDDDVVIRAMVTQRQAETSDVVKSEAPLLAHALSVVGFRPTRTRGTVVGSLTHADPAAELPIVALALDARIRLVSQDGERVVRAEDFFLSYLTTVRQPTEIVVDVAFSRRFTSWGFAEVQRRTGDFAIVAAAVAMEPTGDMRIALAGIADKPVRSIAAEAVINGGSVDEISAEKAGQAAAEEAEPLGDIHGSSEYRRRLIAPIVRTAVLEAVTRAAVDD